MSADSWSVCPNCKKLGNEHEYNTLREDYEFYLEDDILNIEYFCSCAECGFKFGYNKNVNIMDGK